MTKVKYRSGNSVVELLDTEKIENRIASLESRMNAMNPASQGNWIISTISNFVIGYRQVTASTPSSGNIERAVLNVTLPFAMSDYTISPTLVVESIPAEFVSSHDITFLTLHRASNFDLALMRSTAEYLPASGLWDISLTLVGTKA